MDTHAVAKRLVELCRAGEYDKAQQELYAEHAVSIEPDGLPPGALGNARGMEAIREKGRQFNERIEAVHENRIGDAVVAGNWFIVPMGMAVSMKGRGRMDMNEIAVYQVLDGKIVHEQFFYDVSGK